MNHKYIIFILVFLCYNNCVPANAFDDADTHPKLTKAATVNPNLKNSLVTFIGYSSGFNKVFQGVDRNGNIQNYNVVTWLQKGSTDEDDLNFCRASNHFHNPIHSGDWLQSQMTDSLWVDVFCGTTKRYSAVTWATGYKSPTDYIGARIGQYVDDAKLVDIPQNMGWDNARGYFYDALTASDPVVREEKFVKTFRAVGQVMHLLQDMAVPAHVRNDMESHLINAPIWKAAKWFSNPFEKYVITNYSAIINNTPVKPTIAGPLRVTDFWDNNSYTGTTSSDGTDQGLAEYTNANYFSDFTIQQNNPSDDHRFPFPQITPANCICTDKLPESGKSTKYISRKLCPTDGSPVDHFAAVSLLNPKGSLVSTIKKVWLDDNVHDTYAQQILPRTVGYTAALLDYFFRGKLSVTRTPENITFRSVKVTVSNNTPGEAMGLGEVSLVVRYKALVESGSGPLMIINNPSADYSYKVESCRTWICPAPGN